MEVKPYEDMLPLSNKLKRLIWNISYYILYRPFGTPLFKRWRECILRIFGAKVGKNCAIHASVKIWQPWNLVVGDLTCIGPSVEIYNPAPVILGDKVTISQYAYLCTASHDITDINRPLIIKSIKVESFAWVAADAFVGMGVTIGEGAVVGARAAVFKDVEPWTVVGGNPAKFIKKRELKNSDESA